MPHYQKLGSLPRKRHIAHCRKGGFRAEGLYYEEVVTTGGFDHAYSICYHLRPPTRVRNVEPAGERNLEIAREPVLRHHHLRTSSLPRRGDPVSGRVPLLINDDLLISRCRPCEPQADLYRNAGADEILFVHHGQGALHSMFGVLPFKPFDYVVIPRCTTYQLIFERDPALDLVVLEVAGNVRPPGRYFNPDGQLRLGAPFGERDLRGPRELLVIEQEQDVTVLIQDGARLSRYTLAHHPFDVVGWDGLVYPFAFNADDFEPITGAVHQPPPIHQTFAAPGLVVCTFAPRLLDTHPEAIKVPYAHSNVQADEVLYYVRGRFGSRRGVGEASITWHPRGLAHGPHPGTIVASRETTFTDELAVMIDTVRPLEPTREALALDDAAYPTSWLE